MFTQADFMDGQCKYVEVGTPRQDRWGKADHEAGLCSYDQIGTPCEVLTPLELTTLGEAAQEAFNQLGKRAYFLWAKKNPDVFFDMATRNGMSQLARRMLKDPLPTPDDLTDELMASLSVYDLQRILLKSCALETKEEVLRALEGSSYG